MNTGASAAAGRSNFSSDSDGKKISHAAIAAALRWKRLCRLHHLSEPQMIARPAIPVVAGKNVARPLHALQAVRAADINSIPTPGRYSMLDTECSITGNARMVARMVQSINIEYSETSIENQPQLARVFDAVTKSE
jgi:hypothetical protein